MGRVLQHHPKRYAAFTLVELLVVIAIVMLLLSLLLPALAAGRKAAYQTREASSASQKLAAYETYAADNREAQFVGYCPWPMAQLSNGPGAYVLLHPDPFRPGFMVGQDVTKVNGLRFMGATGLSVDALMTDRVTAAEFLSRSRTAQVYPYWTPPVTSYDLDVRNLPTAMAFHASLGLNTTLLGGSAHRGAFGGSSPSAPWRHPAATASNPHGAHYTTRTSQVNLTSRVLVMASSRGVDIGTTGSYSATGFGTQPPAWYGASKVVPGWWEILPPVGGYPSPSGAGTPQASNSGWASTSNTFTANSNPTSWGFLDFRHGGKAVTVMADGHVELLGIKDLRDMRRWSNKADRPDYNYRPAP